MEIISKESEKVAKDMRITESTSNIHSLLEERLNSWTIKNAVAAILARSERIKKKLTTICCRKILLDRTMLMIFLLDRNIEMSIVI